MPTSQELGPDGTKNMTARIDRLNAVLDWWGVTHANADAGLPSDLRAFKSQAVVLQEVYRHLMRLHVDGVTTAHERLCSGLTKLLHSDGGCDLHLYELELLDALRDFASVQTAIWSEIGRHLDTHRSDIAARVRSG